MRDWTGAVIASITVVVALLVNPTGFYQDDILTTRLLFAGILLCSAGVAFLFARDIHELSFSRHVTIWIIGLAVIAIGATNMDILTGTADLSKTATKKANPVLARKSPTNKIAPDVYVPDTLKINRVERLVTQDPNSSFQSEEEQLVQSKNSSKDSELPKDWKISDEEKEKFERFLTRKGIKFDPETAFKQPNNPNTQKSSTTAKRSTTTKSSTTDKSTTTDQNASSNN